MTIIHNPHMSPKRLQELIDDKTVTAITYHIGNLAHDRLYSAEAEARGSEAYAAYIQGRVRLMQRRVSADSCEYIAVPRGYREAK